MIIFTQDPHFTLKLHIIKAQSHPDILNTQIEKTQFRNNLGKFLTYLLGESGCKWSPGLRLGQIINLSSAELFSHLLDRKSCDTTSWERVHYDRLRTIYHSLLLLHRCRKSNLRQIALANCHENYICFFYLVYLLCLPVMCNFLYLLCLLSLFIMPVFLLCTFYLLRQLSVISFLMSLLSSLVTFVFLSFIAVLFTSYVYLR